MPAKHRLRLDQQRWPGCLRQPPVQRRQHHAIARRPTYSFDLPLENLKLAPQGQHLGSQGCILGAPHAQQLDHEPGQRVEEGGEQRRWPG
jgi:hypothetical protein